MILTQCQVKSHMANKEILKISNENNNKNNFLYSQIKNITAKLITMKMTNIKSENLLIK